MERKTIALMRADDVVLGYYDPEFFVLEDMKKYVHVDDPDTEFVLAADVRDKVSVTEWRVIQSEVVTFLLYAEQVFEAGRTVKKSMAIMSHLSDIQEELSGCFTDYGILKVRQRINFVKALVLDKRDMNAMMLTSELDEMLKKEMKPET